MQQLEVSTLHNVCAVHWGIFSILGESLSTPGGVKYTGGYDQYDGGYHDECGGYHRIHRGCSVHWGFHTNSIVFKSPHLS